MTYAAAAFPQASCSAIALPPLTRHEHRLVTELSALVAEAEQRGMFRRRGAEALPLDDSVLACDRDERERRLQAARDVFSSSVLRFRRRQRAVQAIGLALPALVLALSVPPLLLWFA